MIPVGGCRPYQSDDTDVRIHSSVQVPAGWFVMGSYAGRTASMPAHRVYVSDLEIDRYEVTNQEFLEFVTDTGVLPKVWSDEIMELDAEHPVIGILWKEAAAYCEWRGSRLSTEAEWEKAARGTDERIYPWGNHWQARRANTQESGHGGVVAIGSFPEGQSPYGAMDMIGNAQEWVADYFDPSYYEWSPAYDPQGTELVLDRDLRGGSWGSPTEQSNGFLPRLISQCAAK